MFTYTAFHIHYHYCHVGQIIAACCWYHCRAFHTSRWSRYTWIKVNNTLYTSWPSWNIASSMSNPRVVWRSQICVQWRPNCWSVPLVLLGLHCRLCTWLQAFFALLFFKSPFTWCPVRLIQILAWRSFPDWCQKWTKEVKEIHPEKSSYAIQATTLTAATCFPFDIDQYKYAVLSMDPILSCFTLTGW